MFAQFQSCGVGLQHYVRIFRYSTRLLCNLSVKFVIKVLTIRIALEATERDHFPPYDLLGWYLGSLRTKLQGNT